MERLSQTCLLRPPVDLMEMHRVGCSGSGHWFTGRGDRDENMPNTWAKVKILGKAGEQPAE